MFYPAADVPSSERDAAADDENDDDNVDDM
jgi:hypothetical protein